MLPDRIDPIGSNESDTIPIPGGILSRSGGSSRIPQAAGLRVRFNMRSYVADALEGGDWRKRSPKVDRSIAKSIRNEDKKIFRATKEDKQELKRLSRTSWVNSLRAVQWPLTMPWFVLFGDITMNMERNGLEIVDEGDGRNPVRKNLPDGIEVREEQLRRTGLALARTTSVHSADSRRYDTSRTSFVRFSDTPTRKVSNLSIEDLPPLDPTTLADDAAESIEVGPLTPSDETGPLLNGRSLPEAPKARSSRKSRKSKSLDATMIVSESSEWQTGFSSTSYSVLDGF